MVIATYPERAKTHNAAVTRRVDVLVRRSDFGGAWVQLSGTAEGPRPARGDRAAGGEKKASRSIAGEHDDWDDTGRPCSARQGRDPVTIERWGPIATGGFPGALA